MFPSKSYLYSRAAIYFLALPLVLLLMLSALSSCQSTAVAPVSVEESLSQAGEKLILPDPVTFEDLSDDELETAIIDIADAQVSSNDDNPYAALTKLPYGYQIVYVTWRVESEVNSGGFYQYFHDTNAKFTFLAQKAFKLIKAPKTADLLSRAMLQVEEKMPELLNPERNPKPFNEKEMADNNPLVDLDNEFFDGSENLSALRLGYIRRHLSQFKAGAQPVLP